MKGCKKRLICQVAEEQDAEDVGESCRLARHPVDYAGDDFNAIFDGLADGSYDAVISGNVASSS